MCKPIVAIMLSRFGKLSFAEIRRAIEDLDESVLTPENVMALKSLAPDAEEVAMLKEYSGDVSLLGKPEQFVLAIGDVPRLIPRLSAIAIRSTFQGKMEAVKGVCSRIFAAPPHVSMQVILIIYLGCLSGWLATCCSRI
jgi:hypothetical protein